jgi:hypothetical protein
MFTCQSGNALKNSLRNCLNPSPLFPACGLPSTDSIPKCSLKISSVNDLIRVLFPSYREVPPGEGIWSHVVRYNIYPSFGIALTRFTFVVLRHFPSLQRYI